MSELVTRQLRHSVVNTLLGILAILRNGATVVGDHEFTHDFREKCIERAYVLTSQDLVKALVGLGVIPAVEEDQRLTNLIDVSHVLQKHVIMRRDPQ